MKSAFVILALCLIASSLGSPADNALLVRERRDIDFVKNTRGLVDDLLGAIQDAAQSVVDAIVSFTSGLRDQGNLFGEKLASDIQAARERVRAAVKSVTDRFNTAGTLVRNCIDSRMKDTDKIFEDTVAKSKQCAASRVEDIKTMISNLRELSINATEYVGNAASDLKACTESGQGILATGTCLGGIAMRTEFKGAMFLTQSGLQISRINLALATLPAALDVCAGARLVEAGISSAKVVMEIGSCSASSVFNNLTGNTAA